VKKRGVTGAVRRQWKRRRDDVKYGRIEERRGKKEKERERERKRRGERGEREAERERGRERCEYVREC